MPGSGQLNRGMDPWTHVLGKYTRGAGLSDKLDELPTRVTDWVHPSPSQAHYRKRTIFVLSIELKTPLPKAAQSF